MAGYILSANDRRVIANALNDVSRLKTRVNTNPANISALPFIWVEITANTNNVYDGKLVVSDGDGTFSDYSPTTTLNNLYTLDDTASDLTGMIVQMYVVGDGYYVFNPPVPSRTGLDTSKKYALIDKYESGYWLREWTEVDTCE